MGPGGGGPEPAMRTVADDLPRHELSLVKRKAAVGPVEARRRNLEAIDPAGCLQADRSGLARTVRTWDHDGSDGSRGMIDMGVTPIAGAVDHRFAMIVRRCGVVGITWPLMTGVR